MVPGYVSAENPEDGCVVAVEAVTVTLTETETVTVADVGLLEEEIVTKNT
jgi:hypothetical protein